MIAGLVMLIHLGKTFDSMSWIIFETLDFLKLGPSIKKTGKKLSTTKPNHVFYKMDSLLTMFIFKKAVNKFTSSEHVSFYYAQRF